MSGSTIGDSGMAAGVESTSKGAAVVTVGKSPVWAVVVAVVVTVVVAVVESDARSRVVLVRTA